MSPMLMMRCEIAGHIHPTPPSEPFHLQAQLVGGGQNDQQVDVFIGGSAGWPSSLNLPSKGR